MIIIIIIFIIKQLLWNPGEMKSMHIMVGKPAT